MEVTSLQDDVPIEQSTSKTRIDFAFLSIFFSPKHISNSCNFHKSKLKKNVIQAFVPDFFFF